MSNVCLVLVIGIPGVGKTYLCQLIQRKWEFDHKTISVHVCFDDLVDEENLSFQEVRARNYQKIEALILTKCDDNKLYIFIDDNMYYRSMRKTYFDLAKAHSISFCQIHVTCNLITALRRNEARFRPISEGTVRDMNEKFEPPKELWEKYNINLRSDNEYEESDLNTIKHFVYQAMCDPVIFKKNTLETNSPSTSNFIHNADLILRNCISEIINAETEKLKSRLAQDLSVKKKQILLKLKNRDISLNISNNDQLKEMLYKMLTS